MEFQPNPNETLTIDGITYRIAEHPAAPGIAYGQEGRAGIVYCLEALTPSPGPAGHPLPLSRSAGEGEGARGEGVRVRAALKVFKPRFRLPYLVSQAERIAPFAALPGLAACRRTVLTPSRHADLLRQHPDLTYAVLMPWIEGPTWQEVLLDRQPFSPEQSLALARGLAGTLVRMEEQGIAHCDLSAPNVMLPALALTPTPVAPSPSPTEWERGRGWPAGPGEGVRGEVQLVDLEGLYAPGMVRPQELSSGSMGYAHHQAAGGLWQPEADRFAGAVLLAEMLGFCDPQAVQAAWGESYFDPAEMQRDTPRYQTLLASLRRNWGERVAGLFQRAWASDTLADCPTFGEWLVALPLTPSLLPLSRTAGEGEGVAAEPPGVGVRATDLTRAQVRALMQAARQLEEAGHLEGARLTYQQAQALATADPALASLAREIALVVEGLGMPQARLVTPPTVQEEPTFQHTSDLKPISDHISQVSPLIWPAWAIMTSVTTALGYTLFNLVDIGSMFSITSLPVIRALSGLVSGLISGAGQWVILRRYLQRAGWWVMASTIGAFLGGLTGGTIWAYLLANGLTSPPFGAISDLAGGLLGGFSQWLVLRRFVQAAEGWILIVAVAWAMGWLLNGVWSWDKGWGIQGAVVGLVSGAITGAVLPMVLNLRRGNTM